LRKLVFVRPVVAVGSSWYASLLAYCQ